MHEATKTYGASLNCQKEHYFAYFGAKLTNLVQKWLRKVFYALFVIWPLCWIKSFDKNSLRYAHLNFDWQKVTYFFCGFYTSSTKPRCMIWFWLGSGDCKRPKWSSVLCCFLHCILYFYELFYVISLPLHLFLSIVDAAYR